MTECTLCMRETDQLRDLGFGMICHACAEFNEPDRYKEGPPTDFPLTRSIRSEVEQLSCVTCGGTQFLVAKGSYYTAIKCPKCGWEACAHEG